MADEHLRLLTNRIINIVGTECNAESGPSLLCIGMAASGIIAQVGIEHGQENMEQILEMFHEMVSNATKAKFASRACPQLSTAVN